MDEILEMLRRLRDPGSVVREGEMRRQAPPRQSIFAPRTLADSLQVVSGGFRTADVPALLGGASAQVADIPGLRRTVLMGPEGQTAREQGSGDSILAHEVGHVVDFASREGGKLREELGLDREAFAELFEAAMLDPRIRGPVSPQKQKVIDFIDRRINQFVQRREQGLTAARSSTAVARPRR